MTQFARQTIDKKQVKLWKIIGIIIFTVTLMNFSLKLSEGLGPVFSSLIALGVIAIGTMICARIIYNNLAEYNYRFIERKIILERHIGRANYSLVTIPLTSIRNVIQYNLLEGGKAVPNRHIFTNNRDRSQWYCIQYQDDGIDKSVIIEPDVGFLKSINENLDLEK